MIYYSMFLFVSAFVCLLWGQYVFWSPRRFSRQNAVYAVMSAAVFGWVASLATLMICNVEHSVLFANISLLASNLVSAYLFLFILSLFEESRIFKFCNILVPLLGIGTWLQKYLSGATTMVETEYGHFYVDRLCSANIIFFGYNIALLVASFVVVLLLYRRAGHRRERFCLKLFMITDLIFGILEVVTAVCRMVYHAPTDPAEGILACIIVLLYYLVAKYCDMFSFPRYKIFSMFMENVTVPALFADHDGRIAYCNHAMTELFGMKRGELMDRFVYDLDFKAEMPWDELNARARENRTERIMFRCERTSDGERKIYHTNADVLWDRYGEPVAYMIILYDITRQVLMLEELEQQRACAEEARAEAEQANSAKSIFLANMSHEIRTPMNAIVGMNEMIMRENISETVRDYAQKIDSAGNALLYIINDILDFSKIESGKMETVIDEYDFSEVLTDTYNIISVKARAKHLELYYKIAEDIPKNLVGDRLHVQQIILNLLNNAVKYTENGSVTLRCDWEQVDDGNIRLMIQCTDTGIGIRKADLEKMFESFERLDVDKTRAVEGTGLGLAITKQLIESMNGSLKVESTYGEGSTFTVVLPQGMMELQPIENFEDVVKAQEQKRREDEEAFIAPDAKIMIVDDNRVNLMVVEALLKEVGARITSCTSGRECIRKLEEETYYIVFLDHMMPEMDGIDTIKEIRSRKEEYYRTLPVIAFTANAVKEMEMIFLQAGMNDYLFKPVRGNELKKVLRKWLPQNKIIDCRTDAQMLKQLAPSDVDNLLAFLQEQEKEELLQTHRSRKMTEQNGVDAAILQVFAQMIDEKASLIERCEQTNQWKSYLTEVHALKSSSRSIGASELADLAQKLETAAKEEQYDLIHAETPELLRQYRGYKVTLQEYLGTEDSRDVEEVNTEVAIECLQNLLSGIDEFDMDMIERMVERLEHMDWDSDTLYYVKEIKKASVNVNYDICAEWAHQFMDNLDNSNK